MFVYSLLFLQVFYLFICFLCFTESLSILLPPEDFQMVWCYLTTGFQMYQTFLHCVGESITNTI